MFDDDPLDRLTKPEIVDLLNRSWMTHDGMWFLHAFRELGIETANRLNRAAIRSLAPLEVPRILRALGRERKRLESFAQVKGFLYGASFLVIPRFMGGRFSFPVEGTMRWEFPAGQCFAYKGMKRIGALEGYECGVLFRLQCWFEVLGLIVKVNPPPGRCLMIHGKSCAGTFHFQFDKRDDRGEKPGPDQAGRPRAIP